MPKADNFGVRWAEFQEEYPNLSNQPVAYVTLHGKPEVGLPTEHSADLLPLVPAAGLRHPGAAGRPNRQA
jgi:hypothetical protein